MKQTAIVMALAVLAAGANTPASAAEAPILAGAAAPLVQGNRAALAEADALLARSARDYGRPSYSPSTAVRFSEDDNVFMRNALAVDFTYGAATVTLPLFKGLGPRGEAVHYIITEASDFETANRLGVNYSPKLRHTAGTPGEQRVTIQDGVVRFRGSVDFSPNYELVPGSPYPFPPARAVPGAVADAEWSSMVVMPSGVVLNMQIVGNATGRHDRANSLDERRGTVVLQLLDGFQGGEQYYYHLVTDVSADVPAVIEKGVFAPRIGNTPAFGQSTPDRPSALLGFSPVVNGILDPATGQNQGFATSIANGGIDPINVFPLDPDNDNPSLDNNYSPMWDAHVVVWTDQAIAANRVRRITSIQDLERLVAAGDVATAPVAPEGPGNPFVAGVRPLGVVINCPTIAQPRRVRRAS